MEQYNGNSEMDNIELNFFDEICAMIKDMKLRKTIEFEHLPVFGDGNHGNYLHYILLSVCIIVVIFYMY